MTTASTTRMNADALREVAGSCGCGASKRFEGAIEARQLSFERDGRLVLSAINLRIAPGQTVAVLGANGAGKTTLLRCLAGLLRPTAGEVRWLGQSPQQNPALRQAIGMVAHQDWLYGELTPRENLLFSAKMYGVPDATARVDKLLSEAGLVPNANKATDQLSHGMRRRLSVCRALVHDPPLLLFDEVFSGLDDVGQSWLQRLITELRNRSRAICLTTHRIELASSMSDRFVQLENGKLLNIAVASREIVQARCWEDAA
jgi:heme exporter protein A